MIMIGQLIHRDFQRVLIKPRHMVAQRTSKCIWISKQVTAELITVLLHTGQKPCNRLHKCIVVHNGIPLIAQKPCLWITIMLRKDQCIWICFLHSCPEITPETMVKLFSITKVGSHVQTPAIHVVRRRNPFFTDTHNIFI
jgi:hypothetical protein